MDRRNLALGSTCLLIVLIGSQAFASSVSGFVRQPSNRPAVGAVVTFTCPATEPIPATSDQNGRYRAKGLPDVKWCSLTVNYNNQISNAIRINSGSGGKDINIKLQESASGWKVTL